MTSDPAGVQHQLEARLCVGSHTSVANVGVTSMVVETSMDGVSFDLVYALTSPSAATCPPPWVFDGDAGACVAPSGPGCHSISTTPANPYVFVRAAVEGVQFGQVCAFGPAGRPTSIDSELDLFVRGV